MGSPAVNMGACHNKGQKGQRQQQQDETPTHIQWSNDHLTRLGSQMRRSRTVGFDLSNQYTDPDDELPRSQTSPTFLPARKSTVQSAQNLKRSQNLKPLNKCSPPKVRMARWEQGQKKVQQVMKRRMSDDDKFKSRPAKAA